MMYKKVTIGLLLTMILLFGLVGCTKCIDTEYKNVEVTIVEECYKPAYNQPVIVGKVISVITHPARYKITVDYNGVEYTIDDKETYDKYKDEIGQIATGTLKIRKYDDGSVIYDIESLE